MRRKWADIFKPQPRTEVEDELSFHLEQRVRDYRARGLDEEAARAAALERLGNLDGVREEYTNMLAADRRAEARRDWLGDLRQDLRFAARATARAPLFSMLAIVMLALGIGVNAAVFGVVKSVLLDSLPYADADRLVHIYSVFDASDMDRSSTSPGAAADLEQQLRSFSQITSFRFGTYEATYMSDAGPRVLSAALVTDGFFATLGVRAAQGRTFTADDGKAYTAMLSHEAWQRELGGAVDVVGRTLQLSGAAYEIVGILPPKFVGPMGTADVWFSFDLEAVAAEPGARDQHWLGMVGRLAPGASVQRAQRELDQAASALTRAHPQSDEGRAFAAVPLRAALVGDTRTPLVILMGSAGVVLLITCANLAGALLSRTLSRRKEFAVRVSLGAGRGRLVRQLLTESMLLAIAGAAVGLLLANVGLGLARTLAASALPAYADMSLDYGAVLVTALIALVTGVVFGVAPALSVSGMSANVTLRDETRGTSEGRHARRLRGALVAAQIAFALSLLAGAGLLTRSLWATASAASFDNPERVLTAGVQLSSATYPTAEERARFFTQLEEGLRNVPMVRSVAHASELPNPMMSHNILAIEGRTLPRDGPIFIPYMSVSDEYFATVGIDVLQGRTFSAVDGPDAPPTIVISESMARRYWPNGDAIGARLHVSPHTSEANGVPVWGVIIGIVRDVPVDPALPKADALAYATNRQDISRGSRTYVLRAEGDPLALVHPFQRALATLDPTVPLRDPAPLNDVLGRALTGRRLPALLISAFGALSLLLASVGVYALFTAMAAAREREFGVRLALGSTPRDIAALVLRQGGAWMGVGLAIGAVGVIIVARLLRNLLYGVPPFDPLTLSVALATLLTCAAVALIVPLRRVMRVDPNSVLR